MPAFEQLAVGVLAVLLAVAPLSADDQRLARLAGTQGIVLAVDANDRSLVDLRSQEPFLPASTLKIFTALLALETLGPDFRFRTDFHLRDGRLVVRGYGDPLLISEEIDRLAAALVPLLESTTVGGLVIDNSFFASGLRVPGVGRSANPYDAPSSATAVNFNTVAVKRSGDRIVSGEPQTPLTPLAEALARARRVRGSARIQLGDNDGEVLRYAGELIAAKLRAHGVAIGEQIAAGRAPDAPPLYIHRNARSLADVCRAMLDSSNNFIANQVLLAVGAETFGPPATLEKGVAAARALIAAHPDLHGLEPVEGSGIAYENSATARAMTSLLRRFEPYRDLLKRERGSQHKTGTLRAVSTLAGYFESERHGTVRYVIALPGQSGERRWQVLAWLQRNL